MRILQLCNKMPYPANDGYAIAAYNLASAFADKGNEVTVLAMNTTRHPVDEKKIPAGVKKKLGLHTVKVDNRLSAGDAFVKLLQNRSYNVSRFISKDFEKELIAILERSSPQIVQLEGLYLTPYIDVIRKHADAKVVLRAHNVEHLVWHRNSEQEKGFAKKVYLKVLTKQLRQYEYGVLDKIDALVPVSEVDAEVFSKMGNKAPVHICPVSFNTGLLDKRGKKTEPGSVFFIGTLDWLPNLEGLKWFLDKVWDKVHSRFPEVKFYLAGRNIPKEMKSDSKRNIIVVGEVTDGPDFMSDKQVMVVPLFAGSGMRVKIVEGMAMGRAVISTTIGAEGIACVDKEHILIADTEAQFVKALSDCLLDKKLADRLGHNAAAFADSRYSAVSTAGELLSFYQRLL